MNDFEWQKKAYQAIEDMRPGKKFTHRLLIGIVGFPSGQRPMDYDGDAMAVIVKADEAELIHVTDVREPSHRAGHAFVWTRYDDDPEEMYDS